MNTSKKSDQWRTPDDLFEALDKGGEYQGITFEGFHFDIDLCATKENSKCDMYCVDYLNNTYQHVNDPFLSPGTIEFSSNKAIEPGSYDEVTCFMNPPYSNPKPFIEKAWEDSRFARIVCLVKVDPSTQWWATFWDYNSKCPDCYSSEAYKEPLIISKYCKLGCSPNRKGGYNGPKPGCSQPIYFPKRIKFDPPIESGWKAGNKWLKKCNNKVYTNDQVFECTNGLIAINRDIPCSKCKGKGYTTLSGPAFGCALVIMDRREVNI